MSAFDFGTDKDLKDIFNFAVGFTSMILAIITIIYAYFANNSLDRSINKIESASSTVKQDTQSATAILKNIEIVVSSIPERFNNLEKRVSEFGEQAKTEVPPQAPPEDANVIKFATGVVERFMIVTSINGLKLLYLCCLAKEKELKVINLRDLIDPSLGFDYSYGFLIAAYSAGFINFGDNAGIIKIISIPPIVETKLKAEIEKRKLTFPSFKDDIIKIENWTSDLKI